MHPQSETIEVVFKSGSVVQLVRIHACHASGRGFESVRTAEMPVSRSINRHLFFIVLPLQYTQFRRSVVYLSDMCFKKNGNKKRVPNIYSKLFFLAVWTGLEPATPCVTGMYSNQLNYQTKVFSKKAVRTGLEPATPCVTGMYSNQLNYRTFFCIEQPLLFSIAVQR